MVLMKRSAKRVWVEDGAFRPWVWQRRLGAALIVSGLACIGAAFALPFGAATVFALIAAAGILSIGTSLVRQAANRAFGKIFESEQVAKAIRALPKDWEVFANDRLPGCGDVDLWVRRKDGAKLVVEIKSFRRWHGGWFGFGLGERERSALAQAGRIAERMGADAAVVWLPQGKPTFWQWLFAPRVGRIKVVFGGVGALRRGLKRASRVGR